MIELICPKCGHKYYYHDAWDLFGKNRNDGDEDWINEMQCPECKFEFNVKTRLSIDVEYMAVSYSSL